MPKKPYETHALDFRAALRVKVKSLADEAKIIRREEHRAKGWDEWIALKSHRRGVVRTEARAAQLALGFLRGFPYRALEATVHPGHEPNWRRVRQLAEKYVVPPHLSMWTDEKEIMKLRKEALARFEKWMTM